MDNKNYVSRKELIAYFKKRLEIAKNNILKYHNAETGEVYNKVWFSYHNGCIHEILSTIETLKTYNNH